MRALSRNEQVLAGILAALVLGFAFLLLIGAMRGALQNSGVQKANLETQLEELQNWIGQAAEWEKKAAWISENPPPQWDQDVSESGLVEELQASLADSGMEILNQRLLETSDLPGFHEIGVQLQLRGNTESVVRWLHQLQQPGRYIAIRQLNLKSDADKANLRVEIYLVRHYVESREEPPTE